MKNLVCAGVLAFVCLLNVPARAQFEGLINTVQNKVEEKVNKKVEDKTADAMDTMLGNHPAGQASANAANPAGAPTNSPQTISAYQNYDFKPGENVIFEDHFADDQDGEFPAHWNLDAGQAVVNKVNGEPAFLLTEGNYVLVSPRMKTESYLTDPFTVEFDYIVPDGRTYPTVVIIHDAENNDRHVAFGNDVHTGYFPKDLSGSTLYPDEQFFGKWHHAAFIYKQGQLKAYVDNKRALVVPHCDFVPVSLKIGGIGQLDAPLTFKNVRIAAGGTSNTIGAMLTDGKFVTHGITFDVAKATIKPESMGVLNEIATFLKSNSSAKFEIDGHTDSDGPADKNITLSQQRADAVKTQLAAMGVDASRLSTKGFGATKPIAPNDSPEGKSNNRRVEFIKL